MPLFVITKGSLGRVPQTNFSKERDLQSLIEKNLDTAFKCRFVASEFSTGAEHAGRLDTLALSEDNNPVIIEYKKVESSDLVNQSLFYLSWLNDHRGDFEIAVQNEIGSQEVDWGDIRVICIAPNYRKYDLHAVKMMGANIELWSYRLFENNALYLEEVYRKAYAGAGNGGLTAGQKAAITRKSGSYTFEQHIKGKPEKIRELTLALQEYILGLDPSIDEAPKKLYVAYKISQNIVCLEIQRKKILVFLKLNPSDVTLPSSAWRDVSSVGHFGTGDVEVTVREDSDLDTTKQLIEQAYRAVGG